MKYFALTNQNKVVEIIPEFNSELPNVPLERRYPTEFINRLIEVDDNVHAGMVYDSETGTFSEPVIEAPVPADLDGVKAYKIEESKAKLAAWLATHPMLFTDGKYYSVTEEKQALLNGNLASYERATKAGIEYPLKWNSTGEECTEWTYENLVTLSLTIAAYVAPKVSKQQAIEIAIKECDTIEEIEIISIDYD